MPSPFDWDAGNREHIAEHGITTAAAEQAVTDPRRITVGTETREGEERTSIIGATRAGRILLVVVTPRGGRTRVVTAYPARPRHQRFYLGRR